MTQRQRRPRPIVVAVSYDPARAEGRAPRVAFDEKLGEMDMGEGAFLGTVGRHARKAVQHGKDVVRIDGPRQLPLNLASQLLRLLTACVHFRFNRV